MSRCVVNVATGNYQRGQTRLLKALANEDCGIQVWRDILPANWPRHADNPYAFKAYALYNAQTHNSTLLWCDASIVPISKLEPLWERIERDGYWVARNGWTNYEWTADSAYLELFAPEMDQLFEYQRLDFGYADCRELNREIPHVVATAFGISLDHEIGRAILREYFRLAQSGAFRGPWTNTPQTPCGPLDVRGHRHDQTALSVIAWRLGCKLTDCPEIFAYEGGQTDKTILVARGIDQ